MTFADWVREFDLRAEREGLPWRAKDLDQRDLRERFDSNLTPEQVVLAIKQEGLNQVSARDVPKISAADSSFGFGVPPSYAWWLKVLGLLFQVVAYCVWVSGIYFAIRHVLVPPTNSYLISSNSSPDYPVYSTLVLVEQLAYAIAHGALFMLIAAAIPALYDKYQGLRKLALKS